MKHKNIARRKLSYNSGYIKDLIIKRKPFISAFITHAVPTGYKIGNKRCPFALQKSTFHTSKGHLLHCKRASFTLQKRTYGKHVVDFILQGRLFCYFFSIGVVMSDGFWSDVRDSPVSLLSDSFCYTIGR